MPTWATVHQRRLVCACAAPRAARCCASNEQRKPARAAGAHSHAPPPLHTHRQQVQQMIATLTGELVRRRASSCPVIGRRLALPRSNSNTPITPLETTPRTAQTSAGTSASPPPGPTFPAASPTASRTAPSASSTLRSTSCSARPTRRRTPAAGSEAGVGGAHARMPCMAHACGACVHAAAGRMRGAWPCTYREL